MECLRLVRVDDEDCVRQVFPEKLGKKSCVEKMPLYIFGENILEKFQSVSVLLKCVLETKRQSCSQPVLLCGSSEGYSSSCNPF